MSLSVLFVFQIVKPNNHGHYSVWDTMLHRFCLLENLWNLVFQTMLLQAELLVAVIFFMRITHGFMVLEECLLAKLNQAPNHWMTWKHLNEGVILQNHYSVLGTVTEIGITENVSNWNNLSQGNDKYPEHVVFWSSIPRLVLWHNCLRMVLTGVIYFICSAYYSSSGSVEGKWGCGNCNWEWIDREHF